MELEKISKSYNKWWNETPKTMQLKYTPEEINKMMRDLADACTRNELSIKPSYYSEREL